MFKYSVEFKTVRNHRDQFVVSASNPAAALSLVTEHLEASGIAYSKTIDPVVTRVSRDTAESIL